MMPQQLERENAELKQHLAKRKQHLDERRRLLRQLAGSACSRPERTAAGGTSSARAPPPPGPAAPQRSEARRSSTSTGSRRRRRPTPLQAAERRLAFSKAAHERLGSRCRRPLAALALDLQQSVCELVRGTKRPVDLFPFGFTRTGSVCPLDISQEWHDSEHGSTLATEAESLSWGTAVCESRPMRGAAGVYTASFQLGGSCHAVLGVCRNDALELTTNSRTTSSLAWTSRSCGYSAADGAAVGRRHSSRHRGHRRQSWADAKVAQRRRIAKVGSTVRLKLDLGRRRLSVSLDGTDCGCVCEGDDIPLASPPGSGGAPLGAQEPSDEVDAHAEAAGLVWFAALGPNSRGQAVRVVSSLPGGVGGPLSPKRKKKTGAVTGSCAS
jgi:hypothetical protein